MKVKHKQVLFNLGNKTEFNALTDLLMNGWEMTQTKTFDLDEQYEIHLTKGSPIQSMSNSVKKKFTEHKDHINDNFTHCVNQHNTLVGDLDLMEKDIKRLEDRIRIFETEQDIEDGIKEGLIKANCFSLPLARISSRNQIALTAYVITNGLTYDITEHNDKEFFTVRGKYNLKMKDEMRLFMDIAIDVKDTL